MANETTLPHQGLRAYQAARELLAAVCEAKITDSKLREQAMRAAQGCCLNIAEATGRGSPADQRRVYAIARGEASEAAAALDVAALSKECPSEAAERGQEIAVKVYALLSGLIRRYS